MNETIINHAAQCYNIPRSYLKSLSGGHINDVYQFSKDNASYVLRITPPNDEIDQPAMRAILAWMDFLAASGASVSKPVPSIQGRLIETIAYEDQTYVIVAFEKAPGILGETVSFAQWTAELYRQLGRVVGKVHALSKAYAPANETLRRPEWDRLGNCFNPGEHLAPSQAWIKAKREQVLKYIQPLPKGPEDYGLIHTDLHFGNLFVDIETSTITIFDFDDCGYGWYIMDIAMNLFDILVLYPGADKETFAGRFMDHYLRGYRSENTLSDFWIDQLPHFLKLLEIGIYIQVYDDYDPNDRDSWVGRFMANRKYRLEEDIPYIHH